MKTPIILTIGYSGLKPQALLATAQALQADVIDCRWKPRSRNPAYCQGPLRKLLGDRYLWKGDVLGGEMDGMRHTTPEGIKELRERKRNSLLMCMCHAPGDCHRHHLICNEAFPNAVHIYEDELVLESELARSIDQDTGYEVLGSLSEIISGQTKLSELLA